MTQANPNAEKEIKFTRLYIAGFPKYLTEARLRNVVEKFGVVTDLTIKRTPTGKSREFGFVGFETHEQAKKALNALDNSFIDTRRIHVKEAQSRGSATLRGTAWSNWTKGEESFKKVKELEKNASENSSANIKKKMKEFYEEFDVLKQGDEDSQLREFIGLSDNKQAWKNDIFENETIGPDRKKKKRRQKSSGEDSEDDDNTSEDEESDASGENQRPTETNIDESESDDENAIEKKKKSKISKMSDAEFLKSIQKDEDSDSEEEEEHSEDVRIIELPNGQKKRIRKRNVDVLETGRLFLRNLGYTWTEKDIYDLLSGYGSISAVHVPVDPSTKLGIGFAFATFMFPEDAKKALEALDGASYKGRIIQILPAENPREQNIAETMERDDLTYKQKLEAKRKAEKENKMTWNALYMRSDTVAENMAKQIGVEKRELLGDATKTERMAVRMAKAETELIKQTAESLKAHGIDFSILSKVETTSMRSKNAILIKNLPPNTNATEIEELFEGCGQLEKVVLPPAGTIALVKYYHNNDAKRAFNKNAFRKFKHIPLFLEWAPEAILEKTTKKDTPQSQSTQVQVEKKNIVRTVEAKAEENPENATLFISNINFNTTKEDIEELFATCGKILNVRMLEGRREGSHKGVCFVTFGNLKDSVKAYNTFQNYVLDNHALVIRYSNVSKGSKEEKVAVVDGKTLTFRKIVVKNLAFQATRKELYELFSQYGKIETIRLPSKVAGGHRGFAFVEFVSPEECHSAYEALKHTHLYGRHLVLEYAADDNSLESAQKRARESMSENLKVEKSMKRQKRDIDL